MVVFFFFTRVEIHATAFRFDKFGSYIKMLKRSSRSVRRQRYRAEGMKNPCNLYPFWNAFYYHYNNILYCVHRRRRRRRGPTASRNVFSLYIKYPRIPPRLPSSKQRRFLFHLFIFTNWSRCWEMMNFLRVSTFHPPFAEKKMQNNIFYTLGLKTD